MNTDRFIEFLGSAISKEDALEMIRNKDFAASLIRFLCLAHLTPAEERKLHTEEAFPPHAFLSDADYKQRIKVVGYKKLDSASRSKIMDDSSSEVVEAYIRAHVGTMEPSSITRLLSIADARIAKALAATQRFTLQHCNQADRLEDQEVRFLIVGKRNELALNSPKPLAEVPTEPEKPQDIPKPKKAPKYDSRNFPNFAFMQEAKNPLETQTALYSLEPVAFGLPKIPEVFSAGELNNLLKILGEVPKCIERRAHYAMASYDPLKLRRLGEISLVALMILRNKEISVILNKSYDEIFVTCPVGTDCNHGPEDKAILKQYHSQQRQIIAAEREKALEEGENDEA